MFALSPHQLKRRRLSQARVYVARCLRLEVENGRLHDTLKALIEENQQLRDRTGVGE
jgi:hypothetical protein